MHKHIIAVIVCLLSGAALIGILTAKKSWQRRSAESFNAQQNPNRPYEVAYNQLRVVEPIELTERNGEPFDTTSLDGEVWIVSFFFATCPEICINQNNKIHQILRDGDAPDVTFVSITVDPKTDTPARLREYAKRFQAEKYPWLFLTGELETIQAAGKSFAVNVNGQTHSTGLLLVDRWGRFRDRFSWEDEKDLQRLSQVVKQVSAETQAPFGTLVNTKAIPRITENEDEIVYAHGDWNKAGQLTTEFLLTERCGRRVSSEDLLGKVWVASFFFSKCPSICKQQNLEIGRVAEKLRDLDLTYVSISSDPQYDTPVVLREYAEQFDADPERWLFLTGEQLHVERIGAEMFGVEVAKEQHSTKLMLVDRWGNVRGRYSWQNEAEMKDFRFKVDKVLHEKSPPSPAELEAEAAEAKPSENVSEEADDAE